MFDGCFAELLEFLKTEPERLSIVVMPDCFLDRLIRVDSDIEDFAARLADVAKRKGGSIDGLCQTDLGGGNAMNTASALAALGAKVTPIVCTDRHGLQLMRFHLESRKIDFSHVKISEKPSMTTALEVKSADGRVNIMLRDVGALAEFGPHQLDDSDLRTVAEAEYACVFNWAGTRRFGTELAKTVFQHMKTNGHGKTFFDTADPNPNREKIPRLIKNVLRCGLVDALSVNENEAVTYASQLSDEVDKLGKSPRPEPRAKVAAGVLANHLSARIDLHTTGFSGTYTKKSETVVSAFRVPVLRATGAGDAWNAGDIVGDACGLSDECRLTLANAVAAYYISSPSGNHPSRKQLMKFCRRMKHKAKSPA